MFTDHEREQFDRDGYVVLEGAIPVERVEHYMAVLHGVVERSRAVQTSEGPWALELVDGKPVPGLLSKAQPICVLEPRMKELAAEPAIIGAVRQLLGPEVDYFGTKFFPKLPGGTTSTRWHQDNWYHGAGWDQIVSTAVYLEDTTVETGCLRIVPGSHRGGIVEHAPTPNGSWCTVDETTAIDVVCPAGSVVLFSGSLVHGAYDNFSGRSSYRTAWHYVASTLDLQRFPVAGHPDRHHVQPVMA